MGADPVAETPSRIGSYELLLSLGSGGAATVYLARHVEQRDRLYAVKLTHPHLRGKADHVFELVKEARIATRLHHPNVVQVLQADEATGGLFLVMEYVPGDSLAGLVRAATIPRHIGLGIVCGALDGLHAAHELCDENGVPLGIVHRDFSPHNILVGVDGIARLGDFGIAKSRDNDVVTESGVVKGKFGYMAPEQLRGRRLDRRIDIWAAGVVTWELCTGRRLYDRSDQAATMLRIVTERPARASTLAQDLPASLDDAIARALEIAPHRRWNTARDLAEALRASEVVASSDEIGAFVKSITGARLADRTALVTMSLRARKRRWIPFAAAGALVVVVSGAAAAITRKPPPAVAPPPVASTSAPPIVSEAPVAIAPSLQVAPSAPTPPSRPRTKPLVRAAPTKASTTTTGLLDNPYKKE